MWNLQLKTLLYIDTGIEIPMINLFNNKIKILRNLINHVNFFKEGIVNINRIVYIHM